MGGLHHVAWQGKFEAKEFEPEGSDKSLNGIGSCWSAVAGERRVRSGRWSAERYSDGEHGSYSLYEEEISDVSLSTFYRKRWGVGACS